MGTRKFVANPECHMVETGVANYLSASYLNEPRIGRLSAEKLGQKNFLIDLGSRKALKDIKNDTINEGGEVLGGALWEMRTKWSSMRLDAMVVKSWMATECGATDKMMPSFAKNLLGEIERTIQREAALEAGKILRGRGFVW